MDLAVRQARFGPVEDSAVPAAEDSGAPAEADGWERFAAQAPEPDFGLADFDPAGFGAADFAVADWEAAARADMPRAAVAPQPAEWRPRLVAGRLPASAKERKARYRRFCDLL